MNDFVFENLTIQRAFYEFIENEFAAYVGKSTDEICQDLMALDVAFNAKINAALEKRTEIQNQIDTFFQENRDFNPADYEAFLHKIGYLEPAPAPFQVSTKNVDAELAHIAAPQLVVPINNARFALNAANARWVSLYDALYGTNAIMDAPSQKGFDAERAQKCAYFVRGHLDRVASLAGASWHDVEQLAVKDGSLEADGHLLQNKDQFAGHRGDAKDPEEILLRVHGLMIRLLRNDTPIAKLDPARIGDVIVEAALTSIMDCEDSVAAVDGADKAKVYLNWMGLNNGELVARFQKGSQTQERRLAEDIPYTQAGGSTGALKGRALMFVRNVGHLMRTPAVRIGDHNIYEGLLDAYFTIGIAAQNTDRNANMANSQTGSIYIVKPKMHGSSEVALCVDIFEEVECRFHLKPETVKIGIMDEERRTSANLAACIHAAKSRVAFINTGFLDRTGDEIHTHMQAGVMVPKAEMKTQAWLSAYEKRNVQIGLASGLGGRAQIGKGMWAKPDDMHSLLQEKGAQLEAGANTAWVPSPTAAAIHVLHYHLVDVHTKQSEIQSAITSDYLEELLTPPLLQDRNLSEDEVQAEVENNLQGIMGYVVRWVDQGVGCSTVPDIHDVGLMEDRATCRISAQMVANWLTHGLISKDEVETLLARVAKIVDRQNANDPHYQPISNTGATMQAVRALIYGGVKAPSGYTEPALHQARLDYKAQN